MGKPLWFLHWICYNFGIAYRADHRVFFVYRIGNFFEIFYELNRYLSTLGEGVTKLGRVFYGWSYQRLYWNLGSKGPDTIYRRWNCQSSLDAAPLSFMIHMTCICVIQIERIDKMEYKRAMIAMEPLPVFHSCFCLSKITEDSIESEPVG